MTRHEGLWEVDVVVPRILNLGARWRLLVILASPPCFPQFQLNKRLDSPISRLEFRRRDKTFCFTAIET